ncbi:GTPase-activating protein and VPS9 domain-containing protein 1, partial [Temnothorax longispinosus]
DYQKRSPYIAYLIRCRQGLLSTLAHLDRLCVRVKCDRDAINNPSCIHLCEGIFGKKSKLSFCEEFKKLTLTDEKHKGPRGNGQQSDLAINKRQPVRFGESRGGKNRHGTGIPQCALSK